MALTLTETQALTDYNWLPGSHVQWSMGNVMMYKMLEKADTIGSAEKVKVVLEHAKARGGAMGASTVFNIAKKKIFNAALFPWSYFWAGETIDIEDETQVSGGDSGVNLVFQKLDNVQRSIRDYMGDSFWTAYATAKTTYGGETKPFYGVDDLLNQSDTTPAYGEINMADLGTFSRDGSNVNMWQAYEQDSAVVMSFSLMQQLRRKTSTGNGAQDKPSLYVTTEALKDSFENVLQPAQRFTDTKMATAGFDNIKFGSRGVIVADDKCPSGYVNALNLDKLYLKVHKDFFFTKPVWKTSANHSAKTTQIIFSGGFVCSERRANGRLKQIT